jgi:uncharacterized protein YjiS (DUF1127 family)
MRNSAQRQYVIRQASGESFGRIARRTPVAVPVLLKAPRHSANEDNIDPSCGDCKARSPRSPSARGPGDAALLRTGNFEHLTAVRLNSAARIDRSRLATKLAAAAWRAVVSRIQQLLARAKQRRRARATHLALRNLDARTLRDIGFDRSEILSVATGFPGAADATPAHVVLVPRGRSC